MEILSKDELYGTLDGIVKANGTEEFFEVLAEVFKDWGNEENAQWLIKISEKIKADF